jgi:hypothetical protein
VDIAELDERVRHIDFLRPREGVGFSPFCSVNGAAAGTPAVLPGLVLP